LVGGFYSIKLLCEEEGLRSCLRESCEEVAELAFGGFDSFFLEREGMNMFYSKTLWMAALPKWFGDYLLEYGVPVSCIESLSALSALVLLREIQLLWCGFEDFFEDWRRRNCPDAPIISVDSRNRELSFGGEDRVDWI
jgi:hypothetical protein